MNSLQFNLPLSSKIAVLGDGHAGARDGNKIMMEHQLSYLEQVFIPYLLENEISLVIQTGDIFDVRKYTNTEVLAEWKTRFFDVLEKNHIQMIIYVGNHDMFYKNKISPNSVSENLAHYENITVIEKVTEVTIGTNKFLMVPWICKENEDECLDAIRNSTAEACFGHFEITGAKMESGTCTDGLPLSTFNRFKVCISGHFHTWGKYENVLYVGTPYQMAWSCYGVEKGFWTIDAHTLETNMVKNEREIYHKLTYNEDRDMSVLIKGFDYRDLYVKVVIEHRTDYEAYEAWLLQLENSGAATLSVIEPFMERDEETMVASDGELKVMSTPELIKDYIKQLYPEKQEGLEKLMLGLHSNAQRIFGSD